MPKTIKEFQLNQSTGEVSVEYSDDSTSKFNAADMVTAQTDPVTGGIKTQIGVNSYYQDVFIVRDRYSSEVDDTPAFVDAVNKCANSGGGTVVLPKSYPGYTYTINNVEIPSCVRISGCGPAVASGGTRVTRSGPNPIFTSNGVSVLSGGPQKKAVSIKDITLHGADFATPIIDLAAITGFVADNVFFVGSNEQWVRARELFDSRFINCSFEWGGTSDGVTPGMSLSSGGGFEYTNQVYFIACRFESYRGCAIRTEGLNTNELFFFGTKFESLQSRVPHVDIQNAVSVFFLPIQITGGSNSGGSISQLITVNNSSNINGTVFVEMAGSSTTTIGQYANITASSKVELNIQQYGNAIPTSGVIANWDGLNQATTKLSVNTTLSGVSKTNNFYMSSGLSNAPFIQGGPSRDASVVLGRSDVSDVWYMGRVALDGSGSKWRLMHDETEILYVRADNHCVWQRGQTKKYLDTTHSSPGANLALTGGGQNSHYVTLSANVGTLSIGAIAKGQEMRLVLKQDATGGRTVSAWTAFKFVGGNPPSLGGANAITVLTLEWDGSQWLECARSSL